MKTRISSVFLSGMFALGLIAAATPAMAYHGYGGVVYSGPCCGYYPYYPSYYPGYYYVAPPPVVYTVPPPPVVYAAPAPVAVVPSGPPPVAADQTSPTFTDGLGRTCRHFETTTAAPGQPPATGTACLQPDGSWRTVNE
jgi:hypothetical protein